MAGRNRRFNYPRLSFSGQIVPVSIVRIARLLEKQQERTHRRGMADIERTVAVSDAEALLLGPDRRLYHIIAGDIYHIATGHA